MPPPDGGVLRDWKAFLLSCRRWAAAAALSKEDPFGLGAEGGLLKLGAGDDLPPLE
jgi:hypothetical protein